MADAGFLGRRGPGESGRGIEGEGRSGILDAGGGKALAVGEEEAFRFWGERWWRWGRGTGSEFWSWEVWRGGDGTGGGEFGAGGTAAVKFCKGGGSEGEMVWFVGQGWIAF